jgi:DNA topoisomerase I
MAKSYIFIDSKKNLNAFQQFVHESTALIDISDIFGECGVDYIAHLYNGDLASLYKTSNSQIESYKQLIQTSESVTFATCPDLTGDAVAAALTAVFETKNRRAHRLRLPALSTKSLQTKFTKKKKSTTNTGLLEKFIALDRVFDAHARQILQSNKKNKSVLGLASAIALDLICRRDNKVETPASKQRQITGMFHYKGVHIETDLSKIKNQLPDIRDQHIAKAILIDLKDQSFAISGLHSKKITKAPLSPLNTTKLLVAAEKYLGFHPQKTLAIARSLYDGCDIGLKSPLGLITYPLTDSYFVPEEELLLAREYILVNYGMDYLPSKANIYSDNSTTSVGAIRPTRLSKPPQKVKKHIDADEYLLYTLIWNRYLASQMIEAIFENQDIRLSGGPKNRYIFRAQIHHIVQRGYLQLYPDAKHSSSLPMLEESDKRARVEPTEFKIKKNETLESFIYTEALLYDAVCDLDISLVETLEYSIEVLKKWKLVHKNGDEIVATPQGRKINRVLGSSYPDILNRTYLRLLKKKVFKRPPRAKIEIDHADELQKLLSHRSQQIQSDDASMQKLKPCPVCGGSMILKRKDSGRYIVCENYPSTCQYTKSIDVHSHRFYGRCNLCESELRVKIGRYGRFLACSNFPKCKFTKPYPIDVHCPKPGCGGEIIERITSKGQLFYGCSAYPKCTFSSWQKPANIACPHCGNAYLIAKDGDDSSNFYCPKCKKDMLTLNVEAGGQT